MDNMRKMLENQQRINEAAKYIIDYFSKEVDYQDHLEQMLSAQTQIIGFREEWCYDAYLSKNPPKRFSIEVPDDYRLYVIIHRLKHAYPDVEFHADDDKRTKEQIAEAVERIWNANGYADLREEERCGKMMKKPVMSSWEITWLTYRKIDDLYYDDKIDVKELPDLSDGKSVQYVELIMKHPEVHEEFLREEWMFEDLRED